MASWNTAYNWMMDFEDPQRACEQVVVSGLGSAISGINSNTWPEEFAAITATPQSERGPLVKEFYEEHFWNKWYAQLVSDELCNRIFDFAVNSGSGEAVCCLQQALNALAGSGAAQLVDDGEWGPLTVDAANTADATALTKAFQAQRVAHYQAITVADPGKMRYLTDWIARAEK